MKFSILIALLLLFSLAAFAQIADDWSIPKQHDGKWGYRKLDGQWLVPPVYDDAFPFCFSHGEDPYASLRIRNMSYDGENIRFLQPLALVMKNGLYGLLNTKGEEAVPTDFDEIMAVEGSFLEVWKDNKKAYFAAGYGLFE